jgi:xanthine/uracil permease
MNIRFDRHELAGAFGDIGTDLPLIVGMILAAHLDAASVLVIYGAMQVMTGLIYQRPMPVQPLKAVATIVITQKIAGPTIFGGGLAIAVVMLLLTVTGSLSWLGQAIPKAVVRGIQLGLGMSLSILALKDYMAKDGINGYILGAIVFLIVLLFLPNKRFPAALLVIFLGIIYAFIFKIHPGDLSQSLGFHVPVFNLPTQYDILSGFLLLSLPQIPLSLGNSILATYQVNKDLFPDRPLSMRKIGGTYSLMNFISPVFGGVPVCHG